jgi:hypothetical protein
MALAAPGRDAELAPFDRFAARMHIRSANLLCSTRFAAVS